MNLGGGGGGVHGFGGDGGGGEGGGGDDGGGGGGGICWPHGFPQGHAPHLRSLYDGARTLGGDNIS